MSFEDSPQAIKATTIGFKQYRFTILESYDTKKKQCSAPFCVQVAEFALHEPGSVPTTSTVTTTTTLEAPWADKLSIENWYNHHLSCDIVFIVFLCYRPEIATDQEFKVIMLSFKPNKDSMEHRSTQGALWLGFYHDVQTWYLVTLVYTLTDYDNKARLSQVPRNIRRLNLAFWKTKKPLDSACFKENIVAL